MFDSRCNGSNGDSVILTHATGPKPFLKKEEEAAQQFCTHLVTVIQAGAIIMPHSGTFETGWQVDF